MICVRDRALGESSRLQPANATVSRLLQEIIDSGELNSKHSCDLYNSCASGDPSSLMMAFADECTEETAAAKELMTAARKRALQKKQGFAIRGRSRKAQLPGWKLPPA